MFSVTNKPNIYKVELAGSFSSRKGSICWLVTLLSPLSNCELTSFISQLASTIQYSIVDIYINIYTLKPSLVSVSTHYSVPNCLKWQCETVFIFSAACEQTWTSHNQRITLFYLSNFSCVYISLICVESIVRPENLYQRFYQVTNNYLVVRYYILIEI